MRQTGIEDETEIELDNEIAIK
ncbi:hypothetical protein EVAR_85661_1, partial [Eumeta japonica]